MLKLLLEFEGYTQGVRWIIRRMHAKLYAVIPAQAGIQQRRRNKL
jgi:hypothetical protein